MLLNTIRNLFLCYYRLNRRNKSMMCYCDYLLIKHPLSLFCGRYNQQVRNIADFSSPDSLIFPSPLSAVLPVYWNSHLIASISLPEKRMNCKSRKHFSSLETSCSVHISISCSTYDHNVSPWKRTVVFS